MNKVANLEAIGSDRDVPVINPKALKWDFAGDGTKVATIRLPKGFEFTDINEATGAFVKIQADPNTSLVWRDQVRMLSHDGAWEAIAYVTFSDHERVVFSKPVRIDHASRANIVETDEHFVRWMRHGDMGAGYCVVVKDSGHIIAGPFKGSFGLTSAQAAMPRPAKAA